MAKEFQTENRHQTGFNFFEQNIPAPELVEEEKKKTVPTIEKTQERQVRHHAKRIIEALLFASSEPISFTKIREITDTVYPFRPRVLRELIDSLQDDYISQQHAFRLEEIAQGFVLRSCQEYSPFVEMLYRNKRKEKLSQASAEVLAIIAYRQPITKIQIEMIRGVDCSGVMQNLQERQLVHAVGKLEAPGRPTLYGTTEHFLTYFGLKDVSEMPKIDLLTSKAIS